MCGTRIETSWSISWEVEFVKIDGTFFVCFRSERQLICIMLYGVSFHICTSKSLKKVSRSFRLYHSHGEEIRDSSVLLFRAHWQAKDIKTVMTLDKCMS
jgi:hypothetical protein